MPLELELALVDEAAELFEGLPPVTLAPLLDPEPAVPVPPAPDAPVPAVNAPEHAAIE
jgi:hypothetical protein